MSDPIPPRRSQRQAQRQAQRRAQRRQAQRRQAQRRQATHRQTRRRARRLAIAAGVLAVLGAVVAVTLVATTGGSTGSTKRTTTTTAPTTAPALLTGAPGPEGIPLEAGTLLAPASTTADGGTVDGISCDADEQVAYHVHTHLSVFVDGRLRPIPPGIGMAGAEAQQTPEGPFYGATGCYYWLHVHAQDGVIHIESPTTSRYTLGQFFAVWGQPLSSTRVASASGTVVAFVDGRRYPGDPADIPLGSHEDVQLDVGTPVVAPEAVDWARSQL